MPDKISPEEFAAKIKAKYPQYKDVDNTKLVNRIIEKYPEYAKSVDFGGEKKKDGSKQTQNSLSALNGGGATSSNGSNLFQTPVNTDTPTVLTETGEQIATTEPAPVVDESTGNLGLQVKANGLGSSLTTPGGFQSDITDEITNKRTPSEQRLDAAGNAYATVQGEDAANEILNASQNRQQETVSIDTENQGNGFGITYNSILDGVGSVMKGFTRTAGAYANIKAQEANNFLQLGTDIANAVTGEENSADIVNLKGVVEDANKRSGVAAENFKKILGAKVDKGAEAKYNETFYGRGITGLANSTPAMLAGTAALIAQGVQGSYESVDAADVNRILSEDTKNAYAGSVGLVQAALDKVGLNRIFKGQTTLIANTIVKKAIDEAAKKSGGKITGDLLTDFLESTVRDFTNKYAKGGSKIVDSYLTEYATGAGQELSTVGAEFLLNKATGQSIFDTENIGSWKGFFNTLNRVNSAAMDEAFGGGAMGGLAAGINILSTKRKAKVTSNTKLLEQVNQQIDNENVSDAAKEVLVQKKIALENELDEEVKNEEKEQEKYTPAEKEKAEGISVELDKLETALADPELPEEIVADIQKEADVKNAELEELNKAVEARESKPEELSASDKQQGTVALYESGISLDDAKQLVADIRDGKVDGDELTKRLSTIELDDKGSIIGGQSVATNTLVFAKAMLKDGTLADALENAITVKESTNEVAETPEQAIERENAIKQEFIAGLEQKRDSEEFKYTIQVTSDVMGNKTRTRRLKTEAELKESTDKINSAIDIAKSEIKPTTPSAKPAIQKNDLVTYTDAEGNMTQVPVESVKGDKAVIGVNKDGIYESVEVDAAQLSGISDQVSAIEPTTIIENDGNVKQEVKQGKPVFSDSKVQGTFFHGSPTAGLTEFSSDFGGKNTNDIESAKSGFWASSMQSVAEAYRDWKNPLDKGKTGEIYSVEINSQNPLYTPEGNEKVRMAAIERAKEEGYDAIMFQGEDGSVHPFVFNSDQIAIVNPKSQPKPADAPLPKDTPVQEDVLPEQVKPEIQKADTEKVDEVVGDKIESKKRKPTKTAYGERSNKVLGQEPRNRREAVLDYFVGGGRISLDDFKRFTGFSVGKGDGRPYIGFVKKDGAPLDQVLSDYGDNINDGGDIGSANDIIETLLEFGGSRNKMLAELENLYKVNQNQEPAEMTDEEAYLYGNLTDEQREQVDLIRSGQLTEAEINAILDQDKQEELQSYDEYIDELTFEADRVKELSDILDQFTDDKGNVDWDAIYDQIGDAGLSELSNIEKITNGKQDQKSESGTESQAVAENDGSEKNTAAEQAGAFIENRIKEIDGLIKDQKVKIEKTLAGLSKGNDMFAATGVDDGSKTKTLFAKSATNTEQDNIKRITDPLNAELNRLIAEKENLETNKDKMMAEASAQQEFFNSQPASEDARIVMNGLNPLPALMGSINKFQERYIAQNTRKIEDWIGAEMSMWGQSKNYMKRNASHLATSIFNGIPRSKENITGKLLLSGGFNKARFDASKLIQQLYDLVGSDLAKIEQVHEMLDPDLYASLGVSQGPRLGSIPLDVQMLHDELRDLLDNVHRRNFTLGFIDQATYDKHKGKYVPRLYETFEIPEDVQKLMDEQEKYHPVTKLDLKQFKGRKELDALSKQAKDDLLKDPVYGAVKRLMQLDQNAAIAGYIKQITTETPHLVLDPPPVVASGTVATLPLPKPIPPGYQLMSGKGYGKLDGKYIPNYLAEDFKGFFMLNGVMNKAYDFAKAYDRVGARQFLKKSYTVYNPVVQLGNFVSNFTFAFSAGIDPITFAGGVREAYNNLKQESNDFQTLMRHGILGNDIVSTDLMPLKGKQGIAATKQPLVIRAWNAFDGAATKMYGMSDDLAKMNAFLTFKKQGFTEQQAIRKVYEGFQNYATVGKMWDAASKTPFIGNPFIKFTADLFRIMKNGAFKTPLTTSMYISTLYMMPQILRMFGLADDEDKLEEELRTSRAFIPKVPLGFTDIPLVYKTKWGEVNLARYVSPFYLFDTGGEGGANNLIKKLLPFTLIEKQEAGKGNVTTSIALSDPLLGTFTTALYADTDFRGKSVKDPEATRYRASGATEAEQIENKLTYLGRSWIPQGGQMHDFFLSKKYGEDFYGRTKSMGQSLVNMVVKVQQWDDSDYKKEATKQLDFSLSRMKSLGDERKNIGANILAKAKIASTDLNEGKISKKQYDERVKLFQSEASERLDDNQKRQEQLYGEIEKFVKKYKRFLE